MLSAMTSKVLKGHAMALLIEQFQTKPKTETRDDALNWWKDDAIVDEEMEGIDDGSSCCGAFVQESFGPFVPNW